MAENKVLVEFDGDNRNLKRAADESRRSLESIDKTAQRSTRNLSGAMASAGTAISNVGSIIAKASASIGAAGATVESYGKSVIGATAPVAALATAGIGLVSKMAWDQVASVEQATVALRAYEKDAGKVDKVLEDLLAYARSDMGVLFNRTELFRAAQGLKIMGAETDNLTRYVEIMSRSVGLGTSNWDDLGRVIGRVGSTGKITGIDFEMLTKMGFSLDSSLRNTKTTWEELFDVLDKGIPADAMAGQADTIAGAQIRVQTALRNVGMAILGVDADTNKFIKGGAGDQITQFLKGFPALINTPEIQKAFASLGDSIANFATTALPKLIEFGVFLAENADTIIKVVAGLTTYGVTMTAVGKSLKHVEIIGNTFAAAVTGVGGAFEMSGKAISGTQRAVKEIGRQYQIATGAMNNYSLATPVMQSKAGAAATKGLGVALAKLKPIAIGVGVAFKFMLGPIGLIVAAVAAAIAIFVLLYKNNEGFRDFITKTWGQIKDVFVNVWAAIKDAVMSAWSALVPVFKAIGSALAEAWSRFAEFYSFVWPPIRDALGELWSIIQNNLMPAFKELGAALTTLWAILVESGKIIWESLQPAFAALADVFVGTVIPAFKEIWGVISRDLWPIFKMLADVIMKDLLPVIVDVATTIWKSLQPAFDAIVKAFNKAFKAIRPLADILWKILWPAIKLIGILLGVVVVAAFLAIINIVKVAAKILTVLVKVLAVVITVVAKLVEVYFKMLAWFISNVVVPAIKVLSAIFKTVFDAVVAVVKTAISLISGYFKLVITVWRNVFNGIKTVVSTVFDVIVTVIRTYINIVIGFWKNVGSTAAEIWGRISGFASAAWESIKRIFGDVVGWFRDRFNLVVDGIKTAFNKVKGFIEEPFKAAFNAIVRFWNGTVGKLSFKAPSWVPAIGGKGFSMPKLKEMAQGGLVSGPGTSLSDSIPAMLSNGEFVIRASAVRRLGVDTLNAINEGQNVGRDAPVVGVINHYEDADPLALSQQIGMLVKFA